MEQILHRSYHNKVIYSVQELARLIEEDNYFITYVNLNNFRKPCNRGFTGCMIDSSVLSKAIGAECMSPDYSSVMDMFLLNCSCILYIGGDSKEIEYFLRKQENKYPDLRHYVYHGYFENWDTYMDALSFVQPDLIVISMGFEKQENLGLKFRSMGYSGNILCCGAFISQEARNTHKDYYPGFVQRLNLRWAYRLLFESSARKRFIQVLHNYVLLKILLLRSKV